MSEPTSADAVTPSTASDPVTAGLNLADTIARMIGDERATRYLSRRVKLQLEYEKELAKPVEQQDDARLVAIEKEVAIHIAAANDMARMLELRKK